MNVDHASLGNVAVGERYRERSRKLRMHRHDTGFSALTFRYQLKSTADGSFVVIPIAADILSSNEQLPVPGDTQGLRAILDRLLAFYFFSWVVGDFAGLKAREG